MRESGSVAMHTTFSISPNHMRRGRIQCVIASKRPPSPPVHSQLSALYRSAHAPAAGIQHLARIMHTSPTSPREMAAPTAVTAGQNAAVSATIRRGRSARTVVCSMAFTLFARSRPSDRLRAIGFSSSTCRPSSSAIAASSVCSFFELGTSTHTALKSAFSGSASSASSSVSKTFGGLPPRETRRDESAAAAAGSVSARATHSKRPEARIASTWQRAAAPQPTMSTGIAPLACCGAASAAMPLPWPAPRSIAAAA
mmetsp:Transcript_27650/g.70053  ORF Transcript_27650/g.70053 Transcript_27650/m.70053 type:complete len:255 (-) Transcript_27650:244-1008(-)